jgi:hypothetical protein
MTWTIAERMRFEPAEPSTSSTPSSPRTTVGAIIDGSRRAGGWVKKPSGDRSCSPIMLLTCIPVPGTEDAGALAVRARDRAGQPVRVEDRDVRRGAEPARAEARREAGVGEVVEELRRALGLRPGHRAHEVLPALDEREDVGDEDPARGRGRVRQDLAAVVARGDRIARYRRVGLEVARQDRAPALGEPLADRGAHVARVERRRALGAEPVERVAEVRGGVPVPDARQAAVDEEMGARLGREADDRVEDLEQVRLLLVDLDPLAGERRGGGGEVGERYGAEALRGGADAGRVAPDAARGGADVERLDDVPEGDSTGTSSPCDAPPGAATKKSSSTGSRPGPATSR